MALPDKAVARTPEARVGGDVLIEGGDGSGLVGTVLTVHLQVIRLNDRVSVTENQQ